MDRYRIALLLLSGVFLLVGLARELGGASTQSGWRGCLVDAGVAFLMAALAAIVVLTVLGAVSWWRDWRDALSVVALEVLPAAVGASYARSQLGRRAPNRS